MAASCKGFQHITGHGPDAISLIDSDGEILYGSPSTVKILGYEPRELVGRNYLELIHPEDHDYSRWALNELLARPPGPMQWDARILNKNDNYSWVDSTVFNLSLDSDVQ